jgi:hypothetical protein
MSLKNIYEILNEFKKATTKLERIAVLQKYDTHILRRVLLGAFHPNVEFTVTELPKYNHVEVPPGMSYSNMTEAFARIYLFQKNHPKVPAGLTEKRKTEILIQMLEGLEPPEAEIFGMVLTRSLKVPYLTPSLINEAIPGLLPEK